MITILNNLTTTMGRSSNKGRTSITKRMLLLGSLVSGLTLTAQAQPEETSYLYEKYSMKHYATSQELRGKGHAMAGTIFDYNGIPGNNGVHLLVDPSPFATSVVYDQKDFDERVIGVHYNTPSDIVIVTSLVDYRGVVGANGIQVIRHPSCKRDLIFAGAGLDYWPMGSLVDADAKMLYICGYTTRTQAPGTHPDYNTPKEAFVMRYDLSSGVVATVRNYDWTLTSPLGRDYDMAHRMKFIHRDRHIWVGGICNGRSGSAMMNLAIDPVSLAPIVGSEAPLNTSIATEDHPTASFDIVDDLNGERSSYVFGNYFYPKSAATGMYPQPSNYNITSVDAATLRPVAGAASHVYFNSFDNAWGTNLVYGNERNSTILSGYQDAEKCKSSIPSTMDNVNPFLTEIALRTSSGNIAVGTLQWSTILSAVGTGTIGSTPNNFYELGNGLSNLVFGPVTTVRDIYGVINDDIILNSPIWNKATDQDLNIKYIRTDAALDPKCKISKCTPEYPRATVRTSAVTSSRRIDYGVKQTDVCQERLEPIKILSCEVDGYFKGANTAAVATVGNAAEALVATVYPNPAHDNIQVKLSGTIDAAAAVTVQLIDITGKQLSVLYNGTASGMNASLKLPGLLPNGLYTVTVTYNGSNLKSVPLVIN